MIRYEMDEPARTVVDRAADGRPRVTFASAEQPGLIWVNLLTDAQALTLATDLANLLATGPDPDEQPVPITSAARIRERDLPGLRLRRGGAA